LGNFVLHIRIWWVEPIKCREPTVPFDELHESTDNPPD
jgi:hypothetical protein